MNIDFKDLKLDIQYVDIELVKPFEKNPRTHSKDQIDQIAVSMMKFGWVNPILVDENFEIIAGHGRILAGKQIGYSKVPVAQLNHLTSQEKLALLVADNRITENAGWNDEKLQMILEELNQNNMDLSILGFNNREIENFKSEFELEQEKAEIEDNVPVTSDKVVSVTGDLWVLDNHKVLCGDALIPENIQTLMDGEKATMVFTDPPYNVSYDGSFRRKHPEKEDKRLILNDDLGDAFEEFLEKMLKNILMNTTGSLYICMSGKELHTLYNAFKKAGGKWETYIVWVKNNFSLTRSKYQHQNEFILFGDSPDPRYWENHEKILLGHKKNVTTPWYGGRNQSDVWNFDKPLVNDLHPTMKPVALVERAINNSSKTMDIVLDVFGGSGSTLIAAEKTQRRCRMMELSEKYVDTIIKRWQEFTGQTAIHHQTGKTFEELSIERV